MTLRTVRRLILGFVVGTAGGWLAGLLRVPRQVPATTGSDAAPWPLDLIVPHVGSDARAH